MISTEILFKYELLTEKLKSYYETALHKQPRKDTAVQDYDDDFYDLMVARNMVSKWVSR